VNFMTNFVTKSSVVANIAAQRHHIRVLKFSYWFDNNLKFLNPLPFFYGTNTIFLIILKFF